MFPEMEAISNRFKLRADAGEVYNDDLDAIPGSLKVEQPIAHAFQLANKAALTPEELDDQERREIFIRDQRGAIQLAKQRAREEGLKEGRQEGEQRGEAKLLKRQLTHRFGDLPTWAEERLTQASTDQLEQWAEKILDAQTLQEIFE